MYFAKISLAVLLLTASVSCRATDSQAIAGGQHESRQSRTQPIPGRNQKAVANEVSGSIPEWLPVYPTSHAVQITPRQMSHELQTHIRFETQDAPNAIFDWYVTHFNQAGFDARQRSLPPGLPVDSATIHAHVPGNIRGVDLTVGRTMRGSSYVTYIDITTIQRDPLPSSPTAADGLPDWIAAYPGTSIRDLVRQKRGGQWEYKFNFSSSDASENVFKWYEARLTETGLRCTDCTAFTGEISLTGNTDGRYFDIKTDREDRSASKVYFVRLLDAH